MLTETAKPRYVKATPALVTKDYLVVVVTLNRHSNNPGQAQSTRNFRAKIPLNRPMRWYTNRTKGKLMAAGNQSTSHPPSHPCIRMLANAVGQVSISLISHERLAAAAAELGGWLLFSFFLMPSWSTEWPVLCPYCYQHRLSLHIMTVWLQCIPSFLCIGIQVGHLRNPDYVWITWSPVVPLKNANTI